MYDENQKYQMLNTLAIKNNEEGNTKMILSTANDIDKVNIFNSRTIPAL